jgi:hypothetical protein
MFGLSDTWEYHRLLDCTLHVHELARHVDSTANCTQLQLINVVVLTQMLRVNLSRDESGREILHPFTFE